MKPDKSFFARHALKILIATAFILPFAFQSAFRAVRSNTNDVTEWLPASFIETDELNWYRDHFAGGAFVVISWDGCKLGGKTASGEVVPDDPRIAMLAHKLLHDRTAGVEGTDLKGMKEHPVFFTGVVTGREALDKLTNEPLNVPYEEAVERLTGSLVGPVDLDNPNGPRQTCVIATLSDDTKQGLRDVLGRGTVGPLGFGRQPGILFAILKECGIDADAAHLGGPAIDNVAIDEEGERTLFRLAGLAGLVGLGLAWFSFRSVRLTAIVFASGILSGAIALAAVNISGFRMDAILMSMPAVVYTLGLSGAIHIVNYYRDATAEHGVARAPLRAVQHSWRPCTIAALTTALGLASLYTSDLIPIQKFGVFSAVGVVTTLGVLFLFLPACLHFWPAPAEKKVEPQSAGHVDLARPMTGIWQTIAEGVVRHRHLVATGCMASIVLFGFGLNKIRPTVEILRLFDGDARIIADYDWLQKNLGNLVPMEIVVRIEDDQLAESHHRQVDGSAAYFDELGNYQLNFLDRLELARRLQERIESLPNVDRAMSAATFFPNEPSLEAGGALAPLVRSPDQRQRLRRKKLNEQLGENRKEFLNTDYLRDDPRGKAELWRISARVEALKSVDYAEFVDDIKDVIEPVLAVYEERNRISRELLKQGTSIEDSNVCLLGLGDLKEGRLVAEDYQMALLLLDLLRSAGARTTYHDPLVPKFSPPAEYHLAKTMSSKPLTAEFLEKQTCVVLLHDRSTVDLTTLAKNVKVIDARGYVAEHMQAARKHREAFLVSHRLGNHELEFDQPLSAVYTGVVPLVYKTQWALLGGLAKSVGWAFLMIAVVMMVQLRSFAAGLLSMLPNLFPVIVIFGAMGMFGIDVDIGTVMAASVGLGVAVDDTVHFLTWFRHGMDIGLGHRDATMLAYQRCGRAMVQTTLVGGLGLAVFAISTFTPTQRFGYMMLTLLSAAVVGDLIFLPALTSGPIGRFFGASKKKAWIDEPDEADSDEPVDGKSVDGKPAPESIVAGAESYHQPTQAPGERPIGGPHARQDGPHQSFRK